MKRIKKFNKNNLTTVTTYMGKNIVDKNCEYYGNEELFYVYNKTEDWYLKISKALHSSVHTFERGCSITLHENVVDFGYNWEYVLDEDGFDSDNIITQSEFLSYLNKVLY